MLWPRRSYAKQMHRHAKQFLFISKACNLYANLKKLHSVARWKGSSARFATSNRLCWCASVFGVFCSALDAFGFPPFSSALNFFKNNANTSLTVDSDDLFGAWQGLYGFMVNCKDCRAGTYPEICSGGLIGGSDGRAPSAQKFCIFFAKNNLNVGLF